MSAGQQVRCVPINASDDAFAMRTLRLVLGDHPSRGIASLAVVDIPQRMEYFYREVRRERAS